VGFFKFYSQFDFKQNVVSVRTGHLTRDLFPPPAFAARESETRPHHNFEPRRYITIEDIYDVWDNVTRGVGELELQRIQWELLVAYRLLEPYSKQYEKIQLSWTSTQGLLEPFVLPTEGVTQVFGALPKVNNSPSTSPKRIGRNKYKKSNPSITPPSPSTTRLVFSPPSPPALRPQQNSFAMIPPLLIQRERILHLRKNIHLLIIQLILQDLALPHHRPLPLHRTKHPPNQLLSHLTLRTLTIPTNRLSVPIGRQVRLLKPITIQPFDANP
jgi:hypothetical protein